MESDLLFGEFENDGTSRDVQEHIRAMSNGTAKFRGKTLASVYRRLISEKRSSTVVHCARNLRDHIYTLDELLQGLYCPVCHEHGNNGKGEYGRPFTLCWNCVTLRDTEDKRYSRCKLLFKSD